MTWSANATWDTILVHFVQMLLNSTENWSIKLVVLESLNKLLYMLFFVSSGNFSPFYIACLYTTIHVLYILPVICKNFNTYGLRIRCWFFFLICFVWRFNYSLVASLKSLQEWPLQRWWMIQTYTSKSTHKSLVKKMVFYCSPRLICFLFWVPCH